MKTVSKLVITAICCSNTIGCALFWQPVSESKTVVVQEYVNELERNEIPGTVHGPWAEPMYQDAEVPGQIDARGMYYRMPHRTIVEIRQEKFQRAQYPDLDGVYRERE